LPRFLEAQQQMVQKASNEQLKQIENLKQVFSLTEQQPKQIDCQATAGLGWAKARATGK
jgi:ferritin-like metal-binding protein YciE